jgi:hypothetical protein
VDLRQINPPCHRRLTESFDISPNFLWQSEY